MWVDYRKRVRLMTSKACKESSSDSPGMGESVVKPLAVNPAQKGENAMVVEGKA
jgi:hypothetical protein